jgi:hypothetical protein
MEIPRSATLLLVLAAVTPLSTVVADHAAATAHMSQHARIQPLAPDAVRWTDGFWADRFQRCQSTMIPEIKTALLNPKNGATLLNFEVGAGLRPGAHMGSNWSDGDCYKWLEAMTWIYALTGDSMLESDLDHWISLIAKTQAEDGYISTQTQLDPAKRRWGNRGLHELYNMGHLITAACVHHQVTGKDNFLNVAVKLADYLDTTFRPRPEELAHFGWNPSNVMALVELYRTTGERKYLELAGIFVDMRGSRDGGSDQNQFRVPLREEHFAVGHAVTGPYLWCGAADVCAETGEPALLDALQRIWSDSTYTKMYVTGAIGSVFRGTSARGDSIWEAYGEPYSLDNRTAYAETCANISNGMWSWRMLLLTGDAEFADVMERVFYNSLNASVGLHGDGFFYSNPQEWDFNREGIGGDGTTQHSLAEFHTNHRWKLQPHCYCCPPSVARTIAQMHHYAYGVSEGELWVHLYGGSRVATTVPTCGKIVLRQETRYPWDGMTRFTVEEAPIGELAIQLRIPGWSDEASLDVNGATFAGELKPGSYVCLKRRWQAGDQIHLDLPMRAKWIEANPRVRELRGKAAVMRGPLVYCSELLLSEHGQRKWDEGIFVVGHDDFVEEQTTIRGTPIICLHTEALTVQATEDFSVTSSHPVEPWEGKLYRDLPVRKAPLPRTGTIDLEMTPYFTWANRGDAYMRIWLPLAGVGE